MESLAFTIVEKVLSRIASFYETNSAVSVKVELDKLKETLETITLVLQDAEKKQTVNPLITHWLRKLNDVCYDADDVLDDFEYQKQRMQVLNRGSMKGKVRNFFSRRNSLLVHNRMSHMIKDIRERLGKISYEKNEFSLMAGDLARASQDNHWEVRDETSSHIQASDVLGRDGDAEQIIVHLLKGNSEGEDHNVSILSMVGPGGIGKTTLAKLVYNDERVVENFELQMWVCVSDEFVNKRLLGEIINLAVGERCVTNDSLQQMQIKLQNGLGGQKFLLVLDDVWDKKHVGVTAKKWDEFKTLLNVGGNGSKIIITTRNQSVATLTGSMHVHQLKGLPHEDCMSLFKKKAFIKRDEEQQDEKQHSQRMDIAEDIVRKCGGVPLALATVGSSLRWKKDLHDWMQVRDNDIWKEEGILPALKLSYDALPPYLKPCFAYCSLFPKNYEFEARHLVPLWMAEGFLQSPDGNKEFEEIGLDYIRQLCSRSLFQNLEVKNPMVGVEFTMHDLTHDLAISVAQLECWSMSFRPPVASGRVRHFSISAENISAVAKHAPDEFILQLDKVRTILIPKVEDVVITNQSFFRTCISRFKYLRVLDMSDLGWLEVLPSSIGDLCHLRHLDLSYNTMIEKLPNSICKLHNLQTLILLYCNQLKELPKKIGNLVSLINFIVTTNQKHLPRTFKRLTSLQLLYIDSCDNLKSLGEEIQCLTNLRKLYIFDCGNLELLPLSDWKCLTQLHTLCIGRCNENPGIVEYGEGIWSRIALLTNSIAPSGDRDDVEFEKDEDKWNQLID